MPTTVFDAASIGAGTTETRTHTITGGRRGFDWTYFVEGDADSTDMTFSWAIAPEGSDVYHELVNGDEANVDASGNVAFLRDIGGAYQVELSITNNGANPSTVTVIADVTLQ